MRNSTTSEASGLVSKTPAKVLAAALASVLVAGGLSLAVAAPASAAPAPASITAGTGVSSWAVQSRWVQYVSMFGGTTTPALPVDCATGSLGTPLPAACAIPLTTTAASYDAATGNISAKLENINFAVPAHGAQFLLSDIKVAIDGASGTGTVTVDITGNSTTVATAADDYVFATLDTSTAVHNGSAAVLELSGITGTINSGIATYIPSWSAYAGSAIAPLELEFGTPTTNVVAVSPTSASGAPLLVGSSSTVTVTVDSTVSTTTPTGTVDIYDVASGTGKYTAVARNVALDSDGKATVSVTPLAGGHTFRAQYSADSTFGASIGTSAWHGIYDPAVAEVVSPDETAAISEGINVSWGISGYANATTGAGAWSRSVKSGDVTLSGNNFVFANGVATSTAGSFRLALDGTIHIEPNTGYWVELTDPLLTIGADGKGVWTAGLVTDTPTTDPTASVDTTILTLTGATFPALTDSTANPSIALGYENAVAFGTFNAGFANSWAAAFVSKVPSAIRAYFFQSSTTPANLTKPPLPLVLDLDAVTTTVLSAPATAMAGSPIDLSATVTGVADGSVVSFIEAGAEVASATVDGGIASATVMPTAGTHNYRAAYAGATGKAASSSLTTTVAAAKAVSTVSLAPSVATAIVGQSVAFTTTVTPATSGTVTIRDGSTVVATTDVVAGSATTGLALGVGAHSLTAEFSGSATSTEATSAAVTVTIAKGAVAVSLSPVKSVAFGSDSTLTATVSPASDGIVSFVEGTTVLGTATVVGGVATLAHEFSVGSHSVVANYSGSTTTDAAASAATKLTVTKLSAKVTASGKAFKKKAKPVVKVTVAKLANGAYASGKVTVCVSGKAVKTVTLKASAKGKVSVTLPKKYSKSISVKAKFLGSTTVAAKTSSTSKVSVKK